MNCTRCRGFMVEDHCLEFEGGFGEMWAQTWRCVNCGAVYDAVIEQNRLVRQETVLVLPSGEPDNLEDATSLGGEAFIRLAA